MSAPVVEFVCADGHTPRRILTITDHREHPTGVTEEQWRQHRNLVQRLTGRQLNDEDRPPTVTAITYTRTAEHLSSDGNWVPRRRSGEAVRNSDGSRTWVLACTASPCAASETRPRRVLVSEAHMDRIVTLAVQVVPADEDGARRIELRDVERLLR